MALTSPEVWHVTKVPYGATDVDVARGFHKAVSLLDSRQHDAEATEFGKRMAAVLFSDRESGGGGGSSTSASVTDAELLELYKVKVKWPCAYITSKTIEFDHPRKKWSIEVEGELPDGPVQQQQQRAVHVCPIKPRQNSKKERLAKIAADIKVKAAAKEKREQRKPAWQADLLHRFPQRGTVLCQHAQVAELPQELSLLIERVYMPSMFPGSCSEVAVALKWMWQRHPAALRVKELFETVETFSVIAKQIAYIQSRAAKQAKTRKKGGGASSASSSSAAAATAEYTPIEHIFDFACGHGLLGVLLGYRFPGVKVVCCDLERRSYFDHYIEAFRQCGVPDVASGETVPLSNVSFVEGDMAEVPVPPRSFIATIHACNESNIVAMDMAVEANAAYVKLETHVHTIHTSTHPHILGSCSCSY